MIGKQHFVVDRPAKSWDNLTTNNRMTEYRLFSAKIQNWFSIKSPEFINTYLVFSKIFNYYPGVVQTVAMYLENNTFAGLNPQLCTGAKYVLYAMSHKSSFNQCPDLFIFPLNYLLSEIIVARRGIFRLHVNLRSISAEMSRQVGAKSQLYFLSSFL